MYVQHGMFRLLRHLSVGSLLCLSDIQYLCSFVYVVIDLLVANNTLKWTLEMLVLPA